MLANRTAVPSRWIVLILVAAGIILLRLASAASVQAAECTDTWVGPAEGSWSTAANWSANHAPTESDVACIGSGKKANVGSATVKVIAVEGEGSIGFAGGSLELKEGTSSIGTLTMSGGTLKGAGTLEVGTSFQVTGKAWSSMTGVGTTVLKPGSIAEVNTTSGYGLALFERRLVNEGTMTVSGGSLELNWGPVVENTGTFKANAESTEAAVKQGGSPNGLFVNFGIFEKTAGTGTTKVSAPFENSGGNVEATSGNLSFSGGGSSNGVNSFIAAAGKKIVFGGALVLKPFTLGSGTALSGALEINNNATVGMGAVKAPGTTFSLQSGTLNLSSGATELAALSETGEATVNLEAGTMTIASLTMSGGTLKGAGTLEVGTSFQVTGKAWSSMTGVGTTVLKPGSIAEVNTTSGYGLALFERRLVNEGTMTVSGGSLELNWGPVVENTGTFKANAESTEAAVKQGGSPNGLFVNFGIFEKTAGTGTTRVSAPFENRGAFIEASGKLKIEHPVSLLASSATPHHACAGDPVDCATGNFSETQTDIEIGGRGVGLDLTRIYSAQAAKAEKLGIFGYGWTNSFGDKLTSEESGAKQTLTEASGSTVTFTKSGAAWLTPSWSRDALTGSTEAGFTLTLPSQTKEKFNGSGRLESVTDRNGNVTTLAYNGSGKLETITDPTDRKITLTYNAEGLVEKAKDPMGHEVKYTYESKKLKTVTLPGEKSANWQFGYDASRRMTAITDGRGGKTTNEYDSSSRVITQTDPAERKTTFKYEAFHTTITNNATGAVTDEWFNSNNQPYSITRGFGTAAATTETFTYTAAGLLASRTDGNGHTWSYGYDANGNRTSETDPLERETKWTYNEAHQVLTETTPSGEKTTIVRDANGNPETVSRPAPESKTQTVSYEYGPHGETKAMTDPLGNAWRYEYDSYGDLKAETDPEGDKRSWIYDEDSLVISATSPRGNEEGAEAAKFTTSVERDAQGRRLKLIEPLEGTTKYAYDANGNVEYITDPNGRQTKFTYDADNERTKVERPNGAIEETGYDGAGMITSQTDGNKQKTTYVRNILEQPVEIIDPLERKTTSTFDAAGNLKTQVDPDGRTTTYGYDSADRLKEVSYSDGITPKSTFSYDKNGNLTTMVDGTGESTYEYDQLDRLTHSKDGNGDTVAWEYNLGDEPVGLTYPNGKSISRLYDKAGRLESVTDWLGHTTSFSYNKDSELGTTIFPSGTGNLDENAFDRADRITGATMKKGAETLASLSYARDKAGQVESLISKGLPGAEEESFAYDENERLKTAGAGSYEYDNANNLTKAPGTTNAFDKASQLESATGVTFSYDKEGERTKRTPSSGPATTYKYDQAGNLIAVERAEEGETPAIAESFAYDGTGLLASRTVGLATKHFVWDSSEALPLLLSDGENSYVYGPGGIAIEQISSGETPTYLHHDQLGSTRLLTNSSGEVVGSTTFAPYGAVAGKTGSASSPLGFAGQYTLGQSGLIYLRARFYDPSTAQFMTLDPLLASSREPYSYGADNPTNRVDRTGESWEEVGIPCVWPCGPPPAPVVEPFEEAEQAIGGIVEGLFAPEEISGSVTVNPNVVEARARESEESEGGCDPKELVREGEEMLGRGHTSAAKERWQEWWDNLGKQEKKAYKKARGPTPRKRN